MRTDTPNLHLPNLPPTANPPPISRKPKRRRPAVGRALLLGVREKHGDDADLSPVRRGGVRGRGHRGVILHPPLRDGGMAKGPREYLEAGVKRGVCKTLTSWRVSCVGKRSLQRDVRRIDLITKEQLNRLALTVSCAAKVERFLNSLSVMFCRLNFFLETLPRFLQLLYVLVIGPVLYTPLLSRLSRFRSRKAQLAHGLVGKWVTRDGGLERKRARQVPNLLDPISRFGLVEMLGIIPDETSAPVPPSPFG